MLLNCKNGNQLGVSIVQFYITSRVEEISEKLYAHELLNSTQLFDTVIFFFCLFLCNFSTPLHYAIAKALII